MHFISALAYPCDLSLRTENLVHKNTVPYKCVFFSLKPQLWSHRCYGLQKTPTSPHSYPSNHTPLRFTYQCRKQMTFPLVYSVQCWPTSKLWIQNPGAPHSHAKLCVTSPFLHLCFIKSWHLGTKSMTFPILLWRFPWISAYYLGVRQPHQEIIALYTCCKYRVSRHGCQIKFPSSTFVTICSTSVCHEPAHNTFVYCFLITAGG